MAARPLVGAPLVGDDCLSIDQPPDHPLRVGYRPSRRGNRHPSCSRAALYPLQPAPGRGRIGAQLCGRGRELDGDQCPARRLDPSLSTAGYGLSQQQHPR